MIYLNQVNCKEDNCNDDGHCGQDDLQFFKETCWSVFLFLLLGLLVVGLVLFDFIHKRFELLWLEPIGFKQLNCDLDFFHLLF